MSKNIEEKLRQANFYEVCENCSKSCCVGARPPITSKRKAVIKNYLKAKGVRVENAFEEKNAYTFPREIEGNQCIFLDRSTKKCRIHPVKPETCVAGPVTFDIDSKAGKIEWFLKMEKICPLAGMLCRSEKELKGHLEASRKEILKLVDDLDAEALKAILKIEEPDTFKIGEEELPPGVIMKLRPSA